MALSTLDRPSFQEAEAVAGPCNNLCRVDQGHAARPSSLKTLPLCEKIFTTGSTVAERDIEPKWAANNYARLAICAIVFLFCAPHVWPSDAQASSDADAAEPTLSSASSTSQAAPGTEEKTKNSGKYDIDRIGQRDIGKGINLYSIEKEQALGQAMAATIDRRTKLVADRNVNDYIIGSARNSPATPTLR